MPKPGGAAGSSKPRPLATARLRTLKAESAYEFDESPEPSAKETRSRSRRSPDSPSKTRKQFGSQRQGRGGEFYSAQQSKQLKHDAKKALSPAAKKRQKAAKCLAGVKVYCMMLPKDKSTKQRLNKTLQQLGAKVTKKWNESLNVPATIVVVLHGGGRQPPPRGQAWRSATHRKVRQSLRRATRLSATPHRPSAQATIVTSAWVTACETQRRNVDTSEFVPEVLRNITPEELEEYEQEEREAREKKEQEQEEKLRKEKEKEERERAEAEAAAAAEAVDDTSQLPVSQSLTNSAPPETGSPTASSPRGEAPANPLVRQPSAAGSLGFELTSQTTPSPPPAAAALAAASASTAADEPSLSLQYEETQKNEESSGEADASPPAPQPAAATPGADGKAAAEEDQGKKRPAAEVAGAGAQSPKGEPRPGSRKRSKLSEKMERVSKELEEEERREAAEKAAAAAAAEAEAVAAAEGASTERKRGRAQLAQEQVAAGALPPMLPAAETDKPEQEQPAAAEKQAEAAGEAPATSGAEAQASPSGEDADAAEAAKPADVSEAALFVAPPPPEPQQARDGTQKGLEEDIIVPSSQPPESQWGRTESQWGRTQQSQSQPPPAEAAQQPPPKPAESSVLVHVRATTISCHPLPVICNACDALLCAWQESSDEDEGAGNAADSDAAPAGAPQQKRRKLEAKAEGKPPPAPPQPQPQPQPRQAQQQAQQRAGPRRSGQTASEEQAGWADPSVRAQLVLVRANRSSHPLSVLRLTLRGCLHSGRGSRWTSGRRRLQWCRCART